MNFHVMTLFPEMIEQGLSTSILGRAKEKGIIDFVNEYTCRFKAYPYMMNISGRDAYAPVLAASGNGEKYLHAVASGFDIEIGVK